MKKFFKWAGIALGTLFAIALIGSALESPEQKAARQAEAEQRTTAFQAEKEKQASAIKLTADQRAAFTDLEIRAKNASEISALETVTAKEIAQAYEDNTVAADQKYKGKRFAVKGRVTNINTDFTGAPYITMGGVNEYAEPQFGFDKESSHQLASVKKGSILTLVCKGKGDVMKTAMSDSCKIL